MERDKGLQWNSFKYMCICTQTHTGAAHTHTAMSIQPTMEADDDVEQAPLYWKVISYYGERERGR